MIASTSACPQGLNFFLFKLCAFEITNLFMGSYIRAATGTSPNLNAFFDSLYKISNKLVKFLFKFFL